MRETKISYMPLEILLLKKGKNKQYLREVLKIAPSTTSRISKNEIISLDIIKRICDHFDCQIQDVVQFVRVSEEEDEA
ncbi:DNA-binding Xre family transcriptional regulator [Bacillus thermophilus]|uniref:DNA-binding Xre family transcriptional regulator n=1 Tax=Siminovitchia thermophila TaxID=1245522 RepID=A0ABS2R071_9BACI|nr:helix-turn-helix domain-containing protein [Siminovitchia thermophila]MBM7713043.1 DNA-binding Xre family transcriptional regulator [Siminovitchia thermophila]